MVYMRKALLVFLSLIFFTQPVLSANKKMIPATGVEDALPSIFIYSIPDGENVNLEEYVEEPEKQISSDDEIILEDPGVVATTLKGYAQYMEDSSVVHLKDDDDNFVLNIKVPQKIAATKGMNLQKTEEPRIYKQYADAEYMIAPKSVKASGSSGNFTFGALYENEVDNIAMLETETGLFTKYQKDKFILSSSFKKSLNTTYAQDYNTVSIAPEYKLNNYFSLKNVVSADITRNRRSTSLVLSVNPLGKKDSDRVRLELGAKETVYMDTDFSKTQFTFSTNFKL